MIKISHMKLNRWVTLTILILILGGCLSEVHPVSNTAPLVQKGVLDLAAWNFDSDGPVRLDGEWEVVWDALVPPDEMHLQQSATKHFTNLPSPWSKSKPGANFFDSSGAATLRLVITNASSSEQLALRLRSIYDAWELWVNGQKVAQNGKPSLNAEDEESTMSPKLVLLQVEGDRRSESTPLELVLHVSNHNYRGGGINSSIWLGAQPTMSSQVLRDKSIAMFFIGCLIFVGIYHIVLSWFYKNDKSLIYLAIFCLLWAVCYACSNHSDWVSLAFFPSLSPYWLEYSGIVCFFLAVPIGGSFIDWLYPQECSSRALRLLWVFSGVFAALGLLGSLKILTIALPLFFPGLVVFIFYYITGLFRAWRAGREGAAFMFVGCLVLGLIGIKDILNILRVIPSQPFMAQGVLIFVLSQTFVLSRRLLRAFSAVEKLSEQLEEKNLNLEEEIAERNRLERKIVSISEEERRRMSADLHDSICQLLASARLRCANLSRLQKIESSSLHNNGDGNKELGKLSDLLDTLMDKAYDVSHGLWPHEHVIKSSGPSLANMIERLSQSSEIPISFIHNPACKTCPPNQNVTQLHRIAQEGVVNAVKHSKATQITLTISCKKDGIVTVKIEDNGIGMSKAKTTDGGLGLEIMIHRARMIGGTLTFGETAEGGTVITCSASCRH